MMDFRKSIALACTVLFSAAGLSLCPGQEIDSREIFFRTGRIPGQVISRPDTLTAVFIGDVMLHEKQISSTHELFLRSHPETGSCIHCRYDFSRYFSRIKDRLSGAGLCVANMEFTLGGPPFTGYPSFSAPDSYAGYLADCGIDVFLTANNHILDKGKAGAVRTLEQYSRLGSSHGICTTGTFADSVSYHRDNPLILDTCGMKIALVNFTYGTNRYIPDSYPRVNRSDRKSLSVLLQKAEESGADITIALPHWGEEYSLKHSDRQKELALWLAENGADLIIGTHPHVVQDSTVIRTVNTKGENVEVPVFYSLGNAISNMSAQDTQIGLMVKISAVKKMNGKTDILSVEADYIWCSLPGRLDDTHCTLPVEQYIGKRSEWRMPYEYDKMVSSYMRVKAVTGIEDQSE